MPDDVKDLYIVQPSLVEQADADLAQFIKRRISDKQKRNELKDAHGDNGRSMLAALHIEVRVRSLGSESKIVEKLNKMTEKGLAAAQKKAFNAYITATDELYVSLPMNSHHAADAMRAHRMIRVVIKTFKSKEEQLRTAGELEMRFTAKSTDKTNSTAVKTVIREWMQERADYLSDDEDDPLPGEALQADSRPRRDANKTNAGRQPFKPFEWRDGMAACMVCGMLGHRHRACQEPGWKPTTANCFAPPPDYKVTPKPAATCEAGSGKMAEMCNRRDSEVDEQLRRASRSCTGTMRVTRARQRSPRPRRRR